jgi:hypothetical protein
MLVVIIVGGLLVVLTTVLHYEVLRGLNAELPSLGIPGRTKLLFVIISAFFAHAAEIALYGVAFYTLTRYLGGSAHVGRLGSSLANSLYFSAETYTSLGFGDFTGCGLRMMCSTVAFGPELSDLFPELRPPSAGLGEGT